MNHPRRRTKSAGRTRKPAAPARHPLSDRILLWASCVLLATLPWFQVTWFNDVQTAPKQMVLLICVTAGMTGLWWDGIRLPRSRLVLASLSLFVVAAVLSSTFSVDPRASVFGWYGHRFGLLTLVALPAALLMGAGVSERYGPRPFVLAGLVGVTGAALTAFLQEIGVGGLFAATRTGFRSTGGAGSANDLGACMAVGVAFLASAGFPSRWRVPTLAAGTAILVFGALASGGRFGAIALLGALVVAVVLQGFRLGPKSSAWRLECAGFALGIAAGLIVATPTGSLATLAGRYQARTPEETVLGKDSLEIGASGTIRLELWRAGLSATLASPFTGHGPEAFVTVNGKYRQADSPSMDDRPQILYPSAHSIVVDYAANLGLPALLALVVLALASALPVVRGIRTGPAHAPFVIAGVAGYVAMVLINPEPLAAAPIAWILLGCCSRLAPPLRSPGRLLPRTVLATSVVAAAAVSVTLANAEVVAHEAVDHTLAGDYRAAAQDWERAKRAVPLEFRYHVYHALTLTLLGLQTQQAEDLDAALRASTTLTTRFEPLAPDLLRHAALLTMIEPGSPEIERTIQRLFDLQPHSKKWRKYGDDLLQIQPAATTAK